MIYSRCQDAFVKRPLVTVLLTILCHAVILPLTPHALADSTIPSMRIGAAADGFWFYEGETRVMFYQRAPKSLEQAWTRANYIHPLYDLDGNVITEDFPRDHPHHRGIFWAWHQVWIGDRRIGDSWSCQDFQWDVVNADVVQASCQYAALRVQVLWKSNQWTNDQGRPIPFVNETTTIGVHRASCGTRLIDFNIQLQALTDRVRIGGSEDEKGYGGFSPRFRLPTDVRFRGQSGDVEPQITSVVGGAWMDIVGHFGRDECVSGIAILCHPSLPGFPQPWILRAARSMQNPVYPGRHAVPLEMDKPRRLRYALLLHRGDSSPEDIEKLYKDYSGVRADE